MREVRRRTAVRRLLEIDFSTKGEVAAKAPRRPPLKLALLRRRRAFMAPPSFLPPPFLPASSSSSSSLFFFVISVFHYFLQCPSSSLFFVRCLCFPLFPAMTLLFSSPLPESICISSKCFFPINTSLDPSVGQAF